MKCLRPAVLEVCDAILLQVAQTKDIRVDVLGASLRTMAAAPRAPEIRVRRILVSTRYEQNERWSVSFMLIFLRGEYF